MLEIVGPFARAWFRTWPNMSSVYSCNLLGSQSLISPVSNLVDTLISEYLHLCHVIYVIYGHTHVHKTRMYMFRCPLPSGWAFFVFLSGGIRGPVLCQSMYPSQFWNKDPPVFALADYNDSDSDAQEVPKKVIVQRGKDKYHLHQYPEPQDNDARLKI